MTSDQERRATAPDTSMYDFHAHIYFDETTRDIAWSIREQIEEKFTDINMGRFWERNVGPHPRWNYQVAFYRKDFTEFVEWLMFNRQDLAVLVHPLTGNDLEDHRDYPLWLGEKLDLNLDTLR